MQKIIFDEDGLLDYGFYDDEFGHYNHQEYQFSDIDLYIDDVYVEQLILEVITTRDTDILIDYIDQVFNEAKTNHLHPKTLKDFSLDFLFKVKHTFLNINAKEFFHVFRSIRYDDVYCCDYVSDLQHDLHQKVEEIFERLHLTATDIQQRDSMIIQANILADQHFSEQSFTIQFVADQIGISKNYFISFYKEKTGTGYWEYISRLRMKKAKELLMLTREPVMRIAFLSGFDNEYYFSRKFKDLEGVSPRDYRNLYKSQVNLSK